MNPRVRELCRRLKPIIGRRVDTLWAIYLADQTAEGRAEIEQTLELLAEQHLGAGYDPDPTPFPPPTESFARGGELPLGRVRYAGDSRYPFNLRVNRLKEHLLVCGRSGSGKTNLTHVLLSLAMDQGVKVLALDWKRGYRDLLSNRDDLHVYTVGRDLSPIRFNPLIPPRGCEPGLWQKLIIEVIAKAYLGGEGVISLLTAGLDELYRDAGVFDGAVEHWPTVEDLLQWLLRQKLKGRAAMWQASAQRILQALTYGEFGKVLNTQERAPIDRLLDENVVLEMDGLANSADRTFFAEALTLHLYRTRLADGPQSNLTNLIVLEEAHHLLLAKQPGSGESGLENALRMVREYGLGFVIVDQSPSMLSQTAFANTYAVIALSQKLAADVRAIGGAMNLDDEQKAAIKRLPVGRAVVRLADEYPDPFLIEVSPSPIVSDNVTDEQVRQSTADQRSDPFQGDPSDTAVIPQPEPVRAAIPAVSPPDKNQIHQPIHSDSTANPNPETPETHEPPRPPPQDDQKTEPAEDKPTDEPALSRHAIRFLADVAGHRLSTTVSRYDRLRLSRRQGNAIRQQLIAAGLVAPVTLPTRSGQIVLLELTDAGRAMARRADIEPGPAPVTSLEHEYWAHRAAEHFQRDGYIVALESPLERGRAVDLVATNDMKRVAIEVETGKSDIAANLRKIAAADFDRRILLATSPHAAGACQRVLTEADQSSATKIELWSWLDVS